MNNKYKFVSSVFPVVDLRNGLDSELVAGFPPFVNKGVVSVCVVHEVGGLELAAIGIGPGRVFAEQLTHVVVGHAVEGAGERQVDNLGKVQKEKKHNQTASH